MRKLLMQGALLAQSQPISFSSELFHIDIINAVSVLASKCSSLLKYP